MTDPKDDVLLIVEDNPSDLELTLRVLTRSGYLGQLLTAKDGVEALVYLFGAEAAQRLNKGPKVIFLDLKLPKISGLEVLCKIRADRRTRLYPVVILTSSKEEQDIQEAYRLGANSFIVKPIDFEQYTETITALSRYWLLLNQSPV